jgi:hypothetical protein
MPEPTIDPTLTTPTLVGRIAAEFAALRALLAPHNNRIRGALFALAAALVSGYPPPFGDIAVWLGKTGWVGAGVMGVLALVLKASPTPQATAVSLAKAGDADLLALAAAIVQAQVRAKGK